MPCGPAADSRPNSPTGHIGSILPDLNLVFQLEKRVSQNLAKD